MLKNCEKKAFAFLVAILVLLCNISVFAAQVSVKGTSVNVRSGPSTTYDKLGTVNLGYKLVPLETVKDKSGNSKTWYKFIYNGQNAYIRSDFCKEMSSYTFDQAFETDMSIKGFPESYKPGLRDLHANYPLWVFNVDNIDMNFDYAVDNESEPGRTLVTIGAISSYKSAENGNYDFATGKYKTYDGGAWVTASRQVIAAYMDPRNFLYDPYVFQFEHQTFNVNIQTLDAVKEMVKGTFLDAKVNTEGLSGEVAQTIPLIGFTDTFNVEQYGPQAMGNPGLINNGGNVSGPGGKGSAQESYAFTYLPKGTYTYAELIFDACRQVNANPYTIVSMILQEQGVNGSDSVSGKNAKFPGYYNFGNVNAFASGGLTAVENGLKYAKEAGSYNRPWDTIEKAIYGLCDFYANTYVRDGQDTFYLKKWNVQGDSMFKHQYMTNVSGAAAEGQLLGNIYDEKLLSLPHEFKIPVYKNMPDECPIPTDDSKPVFRIEDLTNDYTNQGPIPNIEFAIPENYNPQYFAPKIANSNTYSSQNNINIFEPGTVIIGVGPGQ